jgi:hypothetical protein
MWRRERRRHSPAAAVDATIAGMEQTYMTWGMVTIGVGGMLAGGTGLFLPEGHRLSALLSLVLGAGVGLASLFVQMLPDDGSEMQGSAKAFLVASVLGLVGVVAGLVVAVLRSRGSFVTPPSTTTG